MAAHFEIHATDVKRAKEFYGELFGWTFEAMPGGEDVEYHLVQGDGFGSSDGLTGGLMKRMGPQPDKGLPVRGCTLTFEVADCDERYEWALVNGGAEALPPQDFPGIGRCAYVEDGEGNIVGMVSPKKGYS